jgi:Trypsin-like peptidase domain
MRWKQIAALLVCFSSFVVTPALVQDLSKAQLSFATTNIRIQLDSFAKDIGRIGESSNLLAIYRNLDDQLKGVCKVIYCDDDRKNYADAAPIEQKAADSTVIFVRQGRLVADQMTGSWSLPTTTAGLCTPDQVAELNRSRSPGEQYPPERFFDEPAPGFCTGFKVGKDLVATAGHCVKDALDCQSIRMVTGYKIDGLAAAPNKNIAASRVFACKEIVGRTQSNDGVDWAVIRVDREMSSIPEVALRSSGTPSAAEAMTVVGYPVGLPVKIAGGANVREIKPHFFVTNTDTYGGNSGSPVFSSDALAKGDLLVEGILVRGETDFIVQTPCRISKRCESKQCRGEDATLAAEFRTTAGQ